jgi:hypothetical protein
LYNAEYSFLIASREGVHYGRDVWGRRSLLQWTCPRNCGSFQVISVAEKQHGHHPQSLDNINNQNGDNLYNLEWTEVPPGKVHSVLWSQQQPEQQPESGSSHFKVPCPSSISVDYPHVEVQSPLVPPDF